MNHYLTDLKNLLEVHSPGFITEFGNKNLETCGNYVVGKVQASGRKGFADEEILSFALEYYQSKIDEKAIKEFPRGLRVVTNTLIELTAEEKQIARDKAIEKLAREEAEKMKKKTPLTSTPNSIQLDLF